MIGQLIRLYRGRPRPYLLLVGLWITTRVTVLLTGLLLQAVFNALGSGGGAGLVIWALVAVLVANEAARLFVWYGVTLSRVEPRYVCTVQSGLQDNVVRHLLRRPAAVALDRPAGDVVSRLGGDSDQLATFGVWSASNISRLLLAVAALAIMMSINPVATLALVALVVLAVLGGKALNGTIARHSQASRAAAGQVSTIVGDLVSGLSAVKIARAEPRMVERLRLAGEARRRAEVRSEAFMSLQRSIFRNTAALATGVVLLLVADQMRGGSFTVGDLALFVFYIQFVAEAVEALGAFMGRTKRAGVSLRRVGEVAGGAARAVHCAPVYLDREPPAPPPPAACERLRALTVRGLTAQYSDSGNGIRDVDLQLPAGTLTVVTGPVGSGKSTLLKAVLGMLPIEAGEIRWNRVSVTDPAGFLVPPRAGYVPQVPRLFSGTLRDNVLLGHEVGATAVSDALAAAVFDADLAAMPEGLDTMIGPRGLRLSGGQIQRIAVARMIVRGPELMVLDDPSNALDRDTERTLWTNLRATGATLLVVASRPELWDLADRVVTLDGGRLAAPAPPAPPAS